MLMFFNVLSFWVEIKNNNYMYLKRMLNDKKSTCKAISIINHIRS